MLNNVKLSEALNWISLNTPLSTRVMKELSNRRYDGFRMAYAGHIEPKMVPHIVFLAEKGLKLHVSPCVPGIAHQESFAYLKSKGIPISGNHARSWNELESVWEAMVAEKPDFVFDIGGGLIAKANEMNSGVTAASEATSTGIERLKKIQLSFPVLNWNDLPFKNLLHNRYEVGSGLWYAFRKLTGLDLCRLNVGVIGFGLVGQSVASTARGLAARVFVTDKISIRELSAASEGFQTATLEKMVEICDVIISATGAQNTITSAVLKNAKSNLIIANAGHDSRDINLDGLKFKGDIIPGVGEYKVGTKSIYLLAEGRLLNLAAGGGSAINTFDFVTALILRVVDLMIQEGRNFAPRLNDLPEGFSEDLLRMSMEEIRFKP